MGEHGIEASAIILFAFTLFSWLILNLSAARNSLRRTHRQGFRNLTSRHRLACERAEARRRRFRY